MDVLDSGVWGLRAGLAALPGAAKALPYAGLLTLKSMYCATLSDELRPAFIIHYCVGIVLAFGGNLLTEALLKVGAGAHLDGSMRAKISPSQPPEPPLTRKRAIAEPRLLHLPQQQSGRDLDAQLVGPPAGVHACCAPPDDHACCRWARRNAQPRRSPASPRWLVNHSPVQRQLRHLLHLKPVTVRRAWLQALLCTTPCCCKWQPCSGAWAPGGAQRGTGLVTC
jgi:hypothetical protein